MARNKNKWILFNLIFYLSITFNANSQTPDWSYVNTGISHSFYFPADLIICSNDSVEPGDYVGVFYDSSGTFACGGYMIWNGGNQTLIAYGDDTLTTAKEGFSLEEETYWKTFHVAANLEYFHTALFAHDGFYPDSSCFVVNGASKLTYLGNCVAPVFISYTSSTSCFGDIDGSAWIDILVMNPPYTIEWSDGTLNDSIIDKSSGYYTLSVTNTMGFVTTETIFIPEPDSLEINYISSPVTQTGLPNGGIDLSISGGTSPYFFSWNNGAFAEDLENIFAGFYYVTVSDSQLCENNDSIEVITAFPDPWVIASSPISHDITIPENTLVHFNGESIENGDVIGVFYDSLGVLKCAGKYIYQDGFGSSGAVFSVVGNDNTTPQIEGFYAGGFFNWKIWDASEALEIDVLASYIDSLIWPDSCFFANAGHSAIKAINDIEHDMGISAWINPDDYCNLTNSEPIILEIFSNGMAQENSFTLKYNINGGPWFIQTIPQLVNYLDTFQFEIAYTANLGAEIDYHLKANISLSDDTNPHNDSIEIFLSPLKVIVATVPDTMGNCVGEAHLQISGG
ncbi:MAG: hypothetical protein U9R19_09945, partial [Bacteroidota bacterium]|nr:hypothetical protein [Bacteroidota bacterium]